VVQQYGATSYLYVTLEFKQKWLLASTGGIYKKGPDGDSSSAYQNQVNTYY
jgi:hypothetical protein